MDAADRFGGVLYADTSALVKLLVREPESAAIEKELLLWTNLATSAVTEVELPRAVARARENRDISVVDGSLVLLGILESAAIVPLDESISLGARQVKPVDVGALDAIHVASAMSFGNRLAGVATYDKRMQHSLELLGVPIVAPLETAFDRAGPGKPNRTGRGGSLAIRLTRTTAPARQDRGPVITGLTGRLSKHAPTWERIRELHDQRFPQAMPPDARRPG